MKYSFLDTIAYKQFRNKYLQDNDPLKPDSNGEVRTDHSKPLAARQYGQDSNIFNEPIQPNALSSNNNNNSFDAKGFLSGMGNTSYNFDSKSFLQGSSGTSPTSNSIQARDTSSYARGFGVSKGNAFDSMYKYQDVAENEKMFSQVEETGKSAKGSGNTGQAIGSAVGFVGNQANMWATDHGDLDEGGHFLKNLQSGGEGAQAGASIGGGIGAIIGAVVGLGSGIWDSAVDNRKAQKRRKKEYFDNIDLKETEREKRDRLDMEEQDIKKLTALRNAQLGYIQNEANYG